MRIRSGLTLAASAFDNDWLTPTAKEVSCRLFTRLAPKSTYFALTFRVALDSDEIAPLVAGWARD